MEEVVIVGGGVAGLSCMNALLDRGVRPLLLEAGTIGTPKLCGEFLSPKALIQLQDWGIGPIQPLDTIAISSLTIPVQAGAMSRSEVEKQLAKRARAFGGTIQEGCSISTIEPGKLVLTDGTSLFPKHLFIATGRLGAKPKHFPYIGLKAHFAHDTLEAKLTMHPFRGGYFGIVPISPTESNIACLVRASDKAQALAAINKDLPFLSAPVGPFGLKQVPPWPNTYWIGDAIASLPPASGGGLCHAIRSSLLAAHHYLHGNPESYKRELIQMLAPRIRLATCIHQIMLSPTLSHLAIQVLQKFPHAQEWVLGRLF